MGAPKPACAGGGSRYGSSSGYRLKVLRLTAASTPWNYGRAERSRRVKVDVETRVVVQNVCRCRSRQYLPGPTRSSFLYEDQREAALPALSASAAKVVASPSRRLTPTRRTSSVACSVALLRRSTLPIFF